MKKFKIILCDPPWTYNDKLTYGNAKKGVHYKYKTLSIKDIKDLPIQNIAAEDCTLFLWGTWPLLKECIATMETWGFEYKTGGFVWVKVTKTKPTRAVTALGRYTRGNTEYILIGRRGKFLERHNKNISQLIMTPRGEKNSEKPVLVNTQIDKLYGSQYRKIELFARRCHPGWTATGLEYDKTDIRDFLKRYEK